MPFVSKPGMTITEITNKIVFPSFNVFGAVDLIPLFITVFGNYTIMNVIYGWETHSGKQSLLA